MIPGPSLSNCVLAAWFGVMKRRAYRAERVPSTQVTVYCVFYVESPIVIMLISLLSSRKPSTLQHDDYLEHP